jgi:hypothetical protein
MKTKKIYCHTSFIECPRGVGSVLAVGDAEVPKTDVVPAPVELTVYRRGHRRKEE